MSLSAALLPSSDTVAAAFHPRARSCSASRRKLGCIAAANLGCSRPRIGCASLARLRGNSVLLQIGSRSKCVTTPRSASGDSPFDVSEAAVLANLDGLIDSLMQAKSDAEFVNVVTANVLSFDVKFFLRLAARADVAPEQDKAALTRVSQRVMGMMDGIVAQTQRQMSSSAEVLSKLVGAAADDGTGAFVLPLRQDRLDAVRGALQTVAVDEPVLSNAYAWMRKASDDGLDGMVVVIQRVLQLWAGKQLAAPPQSAKTAADPAAEALLRKLMDTTEESWDQVLGASAAEASATGLTGSTIQTALQQRMEGVVLGLPNGSYAQRIQAEYLKELEKRVKAVFR